MFELNAPASPLSAVMMTICRRGPSRCSRSGCAAPSLPCPETRLPSSSAIFLAYGRAEMMRSCARRSFAAATSFMARVIFCVDWTERIRRWMSRSVAMARYAALMPLAAMNSALASATALVSVSRSASVSSFLSRISVRICGCLRSSQP